MRRTLILLAAAMILSAVTGCVHGYGHDERHEHDDDDRYEYRNGSHRNHERYEHRY
ncbi:MAG: hypothetical protein ACTFAK_15795 [Candidatus Electronema sp. VV]|uniref:hypothetical protein n=1 Tax=Candidatus Electronema sp. V4 TaxID=3454756 RepID=UPI00405539BB